MRSPLWRHVVTLFYLCWAAVAVAEPLTLPREKRPEWLTRDGIVMAGSWEPLVFRVRRDGQSYVPTPEQLAAWQREHSPEMVARLKALGVNFVMMHCYKGAGLEAEREKHGRRRPLFAALSRRRTPRRRLQLQRRISLGTVFPREPQAKQWVVLNEARQTRHLRCGRIPVLLEPQPSRGTDVLSRAGSVRGRRDQDRPRALRQLRGRTRLRCRFDRTLSQVSGRDVYGRAVVADGYHRRDDCANRPPRTPRRCWCEPGKILAVVRWRSPTGT